MHGLAFGKFSADRGEVRVKARIMNRAYQTRRIYTNYESMTHHIVAFHAGGRRLTIYEAASSKVPFISTSKIHVLRFGAAGGDSPSGTGMASRCPGSCSGTRPEISWRGPHHGAGDGWHDIGIDHVDAESLVC